MSRAGREQYGDEPGDRAELAGDGFGGFGGSAVFIIEYAPPTNPGRYGSWQTATIESASRRAVEPLHPMPHLPACRTGLTSSCPNRTIVGSGTRSGLLVDYVSMPREFVFPVGDMSIGDAGSVEPLAVAQTAIDRINVGPGVSCLVVGAGSLGLLACLAIEALGATPVVTDVQPERQARAESLGALPLSRIERPVSHGIETTGFPWVLTGT